MANAIGNISFDSLVYEPADDNIVPGAEDLSSEEFLDKESEVSIMSNFSKPSIY
jgi:hypothetical protein